MNILATAVMTQYTGTKGKSAWKICDNKGNELAEIPGTLTEQQAMDILHIFRKFEKIAFNDGIAFQKKQNPEQIKILNNQVLVLTEQNKNLRKHGEAMFKENERIGGKLDELLTSKQ